ncbi:MAG: 50S ribosomal protein L25/general stress protein Ctc [Endozoicomonadaceae bacterium]|nr:50S ribosomal protein L25/general stress protein Ctc [Endozoicomonadaceae bacterium]MBE8232304.1 50S ribosomal protein L25/general stress protein Ctc [Endozoicomonadaceae bacterium]
MSKAIALEASLRTDLGKGASRRLRHTDNIPAIIYGGEQPALPITLEFRFIVKALEQETFYSQLIDLKINNKSESVILKAVQRHPSKQKPMHLDFMRIDSTHAINVHIPLHYINENICPGVKKGGNLSKNINEVEVRCLPTQLPEFIEVDLSALQLGQIIHLSDLPLPKEVELVQLRQGESHDLPVATVKLPKGGIEDADNDNTESNESSEPSK